MKDIEIKIINPLMGDSIPIPKYETKGSAGIDLRACIKEKVLLKAGTTFMVPIGFAMYLEDPNLSLIHI